jgi:choline dehydrogenase-like flavoprotein
MLLAETWLTDMQAGMAGAVHGWTRGKVLGGSSAINWGMFAMASRQDLELGNKGWGFNDMLPYYRKSETYNPCEASLADKVNDKYIDASLRGTSGPIKVCQSLDNNHRKLNCVDMLLWRRDQLGTGRMAKDN